MFDSRPHARSSLTTALVPALAVLALAGLTGCGGGDGEDGAGNGGQAGQGATRGGTPPGASGGRAVMMELRRVQKELSSIRKQAMQDSALQRELEGLRAMIDSTMRAMSSRAGRQIDRLDSLQGEMEAARSQRDTARMRSLAMEARKLRRALQKVRSKAMQKEEVSAAVESFRSALQQKMREVAPRTDSLMKRADSLQQQMRSRMPTGGDTAGGGGDGPDG